MSVLAIMMIMIGIVTVMLVVNWAYLVLVSRHTLRLSDTLALTAVSQLLDEEVLEDSGLFNQGDDITAAEDEILMPGTGFLDRNNAASGPTLRPDASQVFVVPGRIEDASQPVGPTDFNKTPAANEPYNSLRVEIYRDPDPLGVKPVQLMFRGQGSPETAKITSASLATLDSRVVGFYPTSTVNAPLAPLAIESNAWFNVRPAIGTDTALPDGRLELDFTLQSTSGMGPVNSALISMNNLPLNTAAVENQILFGIGPADVNGMFGPLTAASPLAFDSTQVSPAGDLNDIADAFDDIANSNNPRRAFPIYDSATNPLSIVGFIGARVIEADAANGGFGPRLRVRLQPEFIVHSTVETQFELPAATTVPENLYIHKIRLTR